MSPKDHVWLAVAGLQPLIAWISPRQDHLHHTSHLGKRSPSGQEDHHHHPMCHCSLQVTNHALPRAIHSLPPHPDCRAGHHIMLAQEATQQLRKVGGSPACDGVPSRGGTEALALHSSIQAGQMASMGHLGGGKGRGAFITSPIFRIPLSQAPFSLSSCHA